MSTTRRYFTAHKAPRIERPREVCPLCDEHALLMQDHSHETGLCRDRICTRCNNLLGRIEAKYDHLQRLTVYVEQWAIEHRYGGKKYA
jgi:hypothetical protein